MHRIFLPIYHFFKKHKASLYILLALSSLVFIWYGAKLRYEEDILKLLPGTATSSEVAFSDIGLVDKVFIQLTSRDTLHPVDPGILGSDMEEFCDILLQKDSSTHYINGVLSSLEMDTALSAIDFGLSHIPSYVDTSWYRVIEAAMEPEALAAQMEENARLIMEDETGETSQLVVMDPLNLRNHALEGFMDNDAMMGGFNLYDGHLFSLDKTVALAFLSPSFASTDSGRATKFVRMLEKAAREYEAGHPDIRILMHGNPQSSVSNAGTIKTDLAFTLGISLLLILVIMLLSFHNWYFVWQQVLPVAYGTAFSMACMYWIKGSMSLMAMGISAIVLGVAISYCLHVLIHYYYVGDVEKLLRDESTPVFLGCITTIGAFLGLLFTQSELLKDFGLFASFALIGNTLFALVFLPHFLHSSQIQFHRSHGFPLVEKFNSLPWDRNKWVVVGMVVLIAVGAAFSPRVKFDSDLRNLDYDNAVLTESIELYDSKNADGYVHMYFAAWDDDSLDEALEYNQTVFPLLDSLKDAGIVKMYNPVTRMLFPTTAEQEQRIAAWEQFWTRGRVRELKDDIRAEAMKNGLPADLFDPFFHLVTDRYEPASLYDAGVIPVGLMSNYMEQQASGRFLVYTDVAYEKANQDTVWDAMAALPHVIVLEPFYYCRDMVQLIHDDFSVTLYISSLFVLLVLLLSFRNLWIALIAFFPMFTSWYVMQGYMAIFGLEFNLISIVISTFIYGIGVDYSIFIMEGLLAENRRGENATLKYHKVAIFYSALVLAIVTFSLIFARHPAISGIGIITLIGMASTILISYSLEPWIFRRLLKYRYFRKSFRIPEE